MLQTINLTKIYKPKRGVPVVALNNVNLTFPEKGMVFLLGKSGSGKSTLLNVLGGLDRYDTGEILIQGKSTRHFNQSHFDSYRNTYVGFIFQEYNILEEFSVGANIALALQLQGQRPTTERINAILREVELENYGNRKPNELSGGQKQRVAIARALVKSPKIIMADEPTGALDSATGRQVLNTLKKLSADKLVIVVSHDREFAEQYADRIIELSDGHVIRDVERSTEDSIAENAVPVYMDDSVTIPERYELTQQDMDAICSYIQKMVHDGKTPKFALAGRKNSFQPTDVNKIAVSREGYKLIKSRLPMKYAFKLGASGLKHKKFRLVMTILLSCIALVMFGLTDTITSYDYQTTAMSSLTDPECNIDYATFEKTAQGNYWGVVPMSEDDLELIEDKTDLTLFPVYGHNYDLNMYRNLPEEANQYYNDYYMYEFGGIIEVDEDLLEEMDAELLEGSLPEKSNEVVISATALEVFREYGYRPTDAEDTEKIRSAKDMVGKTLNMGDKEYVVSGIMDTNIDMDRYEALKEPYSDNMSFGEMIARMALQQELSYARNYSLAGLLMVGPGFLEQYRAQNAGRSLKNVAELWDNRIGDNQFYNYDAGKLSDENILWTDGVKRTSLADDEIVIPRDYLYSYYGELTEELDQGRYSQLQELSLTLNINSQDYNDYNGIYRDLNGEHQLKVVGVTEDYVFMVADTYLKAESSIIQTLSKMPTDRAQLQKLIALSDTDFDPDKDDTLYYNLMNPVTFELKSLDKAFEILSKVFFWIGLVFVIFASLLFSNFIAVSISYKKQQIGILRAIGSRGHDVFRIFFAEGFCIAMINFTLSMVGISLACWLANNAIKSSAGLLLTVMNVGLRQWLLVLGVCLLSAFVACYLPVRKIAAKRPIDAIRDR